ncbi:Dam family site-specific DNA-(adenine-N6)-methyltransferase [bacterium]|nr:Dam family site-specific DNA-(adenine-N6)-methyltransferase [bacterium]
MSKLFPTILSQVKAPPIKCQGIKTKLIPFIAQNIEWNGDGRWIEPFLGSGSVLFNLKPPIALVSDTNKHIITFYNELKSGKINEAIVRDYLCQMGKKLTKRGEKFYYEVRDEFNEKGGSLEFLFLNRSCFNGLMRFNSDGKYNVPFGHKPQRFSKSYITKIVNQVAWVRSLIKRYDWEFIVSDFRMTLKTAKQNDFVYLDPPYIGRHTDYFNSWDDSDAEEMVRCVKQLPCGYAISMWQENKYRKNEHIDKFWLTETIQHFNHFYHVGSTENLRNEIIEALIIRNGYSSISQLVSTKRSEKEIALFEIPTA